MKKLKWSASFAVIWAVAVIPISSSPVENHKLNGKIIGSWRSYNPNKEGLPAKKDSILPSYGPKYKKIPIDYKHHKPSFGPSDHGPHYRPYYESNSESHEYHKPDYGPHHGPYYGQNSESHEHHGPGYGPPYGPYNGPNSESHEHHGPGYGPPYGSYNRPNSESHEHHGPGYGPPYGPYNRPNSESHEHHGPDYGRHYGPYYGPNSEKHEYHGPGNGHYGPYYGPNSKKHKNYGPSYYPNRYPHARRQGNDSYIDQNKNYSNVLNLTTGYFKNVTHRKNLDDRNVNLFGINHKTATRKNQLGQNDKILIIIVPKIPEMHQSRPKDELLIPENSDSMISDPDVLAEIARRHMFRSDDDFILGTPTRPEHLPEAQPIHPGHTLLRPSRGMLKSSVKYPLRDFGGSAVYGNLENLGITFGKTRSRIRYSDFRKTGTNFLEKYRALLMKSNGKKRTRPLIVLEIDPAEIEAIKNQVPLQNLYDGKVLDDLDALLVQDDNEPRDLRRRSKRKSKHRKRNKMFKRSKNSDDSKSKEVSSSEESSMEKNEGNPFTIFKNKYYQNYLWNHKLDGLHMNINPYAPQLNKLGPTGEELFYARKWWYFNQDDYKPMKRRR